MQNTLKHVRSLLKPGGYLFLLEITNTDPIRLSFTMGGLHGWWLGVNDGRPFSPCMPASKWNQHLRKAGFSGIDAITPQSSQLAHPFSIMASQAVDDRVEILRRPLLAKPSSPSQRASKWQQLYVLGGQELETSDLIDEVIGAVGSRFENVTNLSTLDDIAFVDIEHDATVVSLLDLDAPVLRDTTAVQLKALQCIFEAARSILWVTHGGQAENPHANATLGLLRSVAMEIPTLRPQVLNFEGDMESQQHGRLIAESLIRLVTTAPWEDDLTFKDGMLWSTEPELLFRDGRFWVPRIVSDKDKNDRLNGLRREIRRPVSGGTPVKLTQIANTSNSDDKFWSLQEHYVPRVLPSDPANEDIVTFQTRFSTISAFRIAPGIFLHLAIGQVVEQSNSWAIAFTADRASTIRVSRKWTAPLADGPGSAQDALAGILVELLSDHIIALSEPRAGAILVCEPDQALADALSRKAKERGVAVKFCTSESHPKMRRGDQWIPISQRTPSRTVKRIFSSSSWPVSVLVDLGRSSKKGDIRTLVASCLADGVSKYGQDYFVLENAAHIVAGGVSYVDSTVGQVLSSIASGTANQPHNSSHMSSIPVADFTSNPKASGGPFSLVDWGSDASLSVRAGRLESEKLFRRDRTYLLVGLTGEIGRSLCQWMARCGAGAVVLTSRKPQIDQAWIDELEMETGTQVKVTAVDATNRPALVAMRDEIQTSLPPLAGIANGSMVLHDQFFLDMDTKILHAALAPKVTASMHLDQVFQDANLDFFIMFSSLASIVGNRGQSNYVAANTFMSSLARQRKSRGRPGSAISIGRMTGLGYLERVGNNVELQLIKYGFMPISEVDLHHLFAQAIMAGLPDSDEDPDIITALRPVREDEEVQVPWFDNPRFTHMILPAEKQENAALADGDKRKNSLPVKAQLVAATSTQAAQAVLEECFAAKLRIILQITEEAFRADAPLVELGVDSLVAVEIRSWFLKEAGVDIAVLVILGGSSSVELCHQAVEQMSPDLLPSIGAATNGKELKQPKGSGDTAQNESKTTNGSLTKEREELLRDKTTNGSTNGYGKDFGAVKQQDPVRIDNS